MRIASLLLSALLISGCSSYSEKATEYMQKQDYQNAFKYYLKAVNSEPKAEDFFQLGYLYHKGLGTRKNLDEAIKWYQNAGEHSAAKRMLGWIFVKDYSPKDCQAGIDYFLQAININGRASQRAYSDLNANFGFQGFQALHQIKEPNFGEMLGFATVLAGGTYVGQSQYAVQQARNVYFQELEKNKQKEIENQNIERYNQQIYQNLIYQCQNKYW